MEAISEEKTERVWKKAAIMTPRQAQKIIHRIGQEQPVILAYLMAAGDDLFNQEERELLLYLGVVIWLIMIEGKTGLKKISEKILEEIENTNFKMIEYLEGEPDGHFAETVELIYSNYNQPAVLKYAVESLMESMEANDEQIRNDNLGMMLIYLKVVIDCLDKMSD